MPVFTKGQFNVNLGFVSFGGEIDEADRQCAWELYCELVSRVAVVGKIDSDGHHTFVGEVLVESLDSLYRFFTEARGIMRRYPVGRLAPDERCGNHLGFFIAGTLEAVVRPFLEKWQARYRFWWEHESNSQQPPFQRQASFEQLGTMLEDWARLRSFCRAAAEELAAAYRLPSVLGLMPPALDQLWQKETKDVLKDL